MITADGLSVEDIDRPSPRAGQVLVRVAFAALNRADLGMARGHRHGAAGGAGTVGGLEWSGEIVEVGNDVDDFAPGDRVMCSGIGGYAEYALCDTARLNAIPNPGGGDNGYSFEEAACLPVGLSTMHDAIVTNGRLKRGDSVLIQGASSGVGILGMQIAKTMGAGLVIGSSTNRERRSRLTDFGADQVIDTNDTNWPEAVREATDGNGVDLIIDQVSASVANDNMKAAAICGRIVNVGRLGGTRGEFDFDLHALKRIDYIGVTFRTRSRAEVTAINEAVRRDLWPVLESRAFDIPVDRIFDLVDISAAQEHMAANRHFGKILIRP